MTQALIKINGVDGSNNNLPINTLVSLDNHGNGGELTYLWAILDQPSGTADALSATNIQTPTFTPKKEGTYLLKLTVNATLSDEHSATAIVGVRQLKSFLRDPAAGETTEDGSTGWKAAATANLQAVDGLVADSNLLVAQVPDNTYAAGQVVKFNGTAVIKTGLPGQETVMTVAHAHGNDADLSKRRLGVIERTVNGLSASANDLVLVRVIGMCAIAPAGAPASGDPVYLDDASGLPVLAIVTSNRVIGRVLSAGGGSYRWFIDDTRGPF